MRNFVFQGNRYFGQLVKRIDHVHGPMALMLVGNISYLVPVNDVEVKAGDPDTGWQI